MSIQYKLYACEVSPETPEIKKDSWGCEILSGDYAGVVFEIENMDFKDKGEVFFDYYVIKAPEPLIVDEVSKDKKFEVVLQEIILQIITNALEYAKENVLEYTDDSVIMNTDNTETADYDRANDSSKPSPQ